MKRTIAVLMLMLVLPLFLCSQAGSADIEEPKIVGDDHPWGGEEEEEQTSQYRHNLHPNLFLSPTTGYLPVDLVVNTVLLYDEIFVTGESKKGTKSYLERDSYIDRTKKVSFK